jgi:hypothetical protein
MTAELRGRGVPAWEVEGPVGYRWPGVTDSYAVFSPTTKSYMSDFNLKTGAGEGIRTLDPNLGKVVLYP